MAVTTTTRTQTNHSPLPALLVALCAAAALIAVTRHAMQPRPNTAPQYDRLAILTTLQAYARGENACREVMLASCLNTCNWLTCEPSPHYKVGCRINGETRETGLWLVGIVGVRYGAPMYVTGRAMHWVQFEANMRRDGCAAGDARLIPGLVR